MQTRESLNLASAIGMFVRRTPFVLVASAEMSIPILTSRSFQLNYRNFNVGTLSRGVIASAIAITLGVTALAQDSSRLRAPRRVVERGIEQIYTADIVDPVAAVDPNTGQGPGFGPIGPGPGCNLVPAPPSVGAKVDLSYFGPPPSASNPSLTGPVQLLKSGVVNASKGTITLPLYLGMMRNQTPVWYILTDVSDPEVATSLGLNFSPKLPFTVTAARAANLNQNGDLVFDKGTVDFTPVRSITPGPSGREFPPLAAQPGSIGDKDYSPFVQVTNLGGVIYNAPIVAFGVNAADINFPNGNVDYSKVHDQVVAIDPFNMTVTINLINGFSFGKPVWYISMDASIPLAAAIEHNTFAPLMANLKLGDDDSFGSPIERIFISTNGAEQGGCDNPQRQGLSADLADGYRPNNVLGGIPTNATDYSPAWDAQLFEWTQDAISKGYRGQVREEFQILTFVQDGLLTGPGGAKFGTSNFSINCPVVQRLN
jgi:hypothetical protein